MTIRAPRHRRP